MFYNFWPLKVGTLHERKILLKKYQNARDFFSKPLNLINKSNEMLFQKVQQRYTGLINTIYFLVLNLTNHETPNNFKYCVEIHPSLEPITALFTITGPWPKTSAIREDWLEDDFVLHYMKSNDIGIGFNQSKTTCIGPI